MLFNEEDATRFEKPVGADKDTINALIDADRCSTCLILRFSPK